MMTKQDFKTGIHKAVRTVAKLPEETPVERVATMLQKTVLGMVLAGVGVGGLLVLEMNHYLATGFILVGATVWSGQLVTGALKSLIQPLRDILAAIRGKNGD
jgi:hypothetical protein